jgi:hypothetical protein
MNFSYRRMAAYLASAVVLSVILILGAVQEPAAAQITTDTPTPTGTGTASSTSTSLTTTTTPATTSSVSTPSQTPTLYGFYQTTPLVPVTGADLSRPASDSRLPVELLLGLAGLGLIGTSLFFRKRNR